MANCDRHPVVLAVFMFIGEIVCENAWLVHTIRHLRRRFAHTIATQQEMEISLRLFPFPTVLSTIYRLRRILFPGFSVPGFRFPDLPSPTDSVSRFPVSGSRFTVSDVSRFPIPDFRFTVFVRFIANRFRVIAYPWTRIFASILPENQPPYGVLVDF